MSTRENLRHCWRTIALRAARTALPISPAPAMSEPQANRPSASHPVEMHAHAIISAPITNTKNEPIANLRIQGISGLHQPVGRDLHLFLPESQVAALATAFQFEIRMSFRCRHHEVNRFVLAIGIGLTECRKLVGTNRNDVWIVAADV